MDWILEHMTKIVIPAFVLFMAAITFYVGRLTTKARKAGQEPHIPKTVGRIAILTVLIAFMLIGMVLLRNHLA